MLIIYIQGLRQPAYVESDQTLVYTGGRQVVNTYISGTLYYKYKFFSAASYWLLSTQTASSCDVTLVF